MKRCVCIYSSYYGSKYWGFLLIRFDYCCWCSESVCMCASARNFAGLGFDFPLEDGIVFIGVKSEV